MIQTTHSLPATAKRWLILSPILVIGVGHFVARVAGIWLGVWAWVPLALAYWSIIAWLIQRSEGRQLVSSWLKPSTGKLRWVGLALLVGFLPLPVLIMDGAALRQDWVWLPWLLFALINPWFEEGYWRGLLLDALKQWPAWQSTLFTAAAFAISHPLMWGVHSIANRNVIVLGSTLTMGIVWAIVYHRTNSLRWIIIAHILVDLFNLAVPAFLNLFVPDLPPIF